MDVDSSPAAEFVTYLSTIATEGMSSNNLISAINILWTLSRTRPGEIDQHITALMKVFQGKLAKDHVTHTNSHPPANGPRNGDQGVRDLP
jgi:transformation/transcription domain-associated protein